MPSRSLVRLPLGAASWYRIRAEIRSRRLQAASVVLVVALAMVLASLGVIVLGSITAPYDQTYRDLHGAHLWLFLAPDPPGSTLATLSSAPNVAEIGEVEQVASSSVVIDAGKLPATLQSYPLTPPPIGRIAITKGQGLAANDPDGVVLDQPFADTYGLGLGDTLTIVTDDGLVQAHIRGLSMDVNHNIIHDGRTARISVLRTTLDTWFPAPGQREGIVGIQLQNPNTVVATAGDLVQQVRAQQGTASYRQDDWLSYRKGFTSTYQFVATLLLAFGVMGMFASGIIVANLITGQALAQRRDTGVLKAIGFTPGQTVTALVAEYLVLGALGGVIGAILAVSVAPLILEQLEASSGIPTAPQYNAVALVALLLGMLLVIALAAALPAWRAGRTRVVDALRPEETRASRLRTLLTRAADTFRVPPVQSLAIQGVAARPLRAAFVMLTLIVAIISAVFGLGLVATLDAFQHDSSFLGTYSDVHIAPGLYDAAATQRLVATRPEVASYYTTFASAALIPDHDATQCAGNRRHDH